MTLPVGPDPDTILAACVETLRDVVLPNVEGEWPRYSADLMVGALEYTRQILKADPDQARRIELASALASVAETVDEAGNPRFAEALAETSPFEAASKLLVAAQDEPGPLADSIKASLHPVLIGQLDAEMGRSFGMFMAFARNMTGAA
jgi:hypothetical protein